MPTYTARDVKLTWMLKSHIHQHIFKSSVRTPQETHYFFAAKPNRLMLFKETVAVYCENHTEHTDTVRTSQETHYFSATETNQFCWRKESLFIVRTIQNTQIHCMSRMQTFGMLKQVVHVVTGMLWRLTSVAYEGYQRAKVIYSCIVKHSITAY
jgi:hypothetical protein